MAMVAGRTARGGAPAARRILLATGFPAIALALVIGLTGCSAGVNGAAGGATGAVPLPAQDGGAFSADAGVKTEDTSTDRSIVTTGWASILVEDPESAASRTAEIATAAGGRVDSRSVTAATDYSPASATLTLRVPADRLDAVLEQLEGLGTVQSVSTSANDVTVAVQDIDARIDALEQSIANLQALEAKATTVDALIQIETSISDRQGELESLQAQQRYYADQVAMSTLTVDLQSAAIAAGPEPGSFWGGVQAGWKALGDFFAGLLIVLGVLLPWLIPLAVIAAIVWLIVAVTTRRRRRPDAAPAPTPPPIAGP